MTIITNGLAFPDLGFRWEKDALGAVQVPVSALYGVHTVRGIAAFPLTGLRLHDSKEFLRAYIMVKKACAIANSSFGIVEGRVARAIEEAADEVLRGEWADQFPTPILQGGGGVSTNMNVNEVLANRAEELLGGTRGTYQLVHPNDHVNRSQSTNDTYPTAVCISTMSQLGTLLRSLRNVALAFEAKAHEYRGVNRLGRTCLRDALPVTVEATHYAHAAAVTRAVRRIESSASPLQSLPLGATAIGTGAGAPNGYGSRAVEILAEITGRPLKVSRNYFDALAHIDPMSDVAHAVAEAASVLAKIASDLRLLSSGPHAGLNEIHLPAVTAGSSIMPGKTNPAIPELVIQVAMDLGGMAHVVSAAVRAGELELNVMEPVIVSVLHPAIVRLTETSDVFVEKCLAGLTWNFDVLEHHLAGSLLKKVERSEREGYAVVAYGTGDNPMVDETS